MCRDVAPEHVKNYLEMLDRTDALIGEVEEAFITKRGNLAELADVREYLDERRLALEAMAGALNDTHILVIPYAKLLRAQTTW